MSSCSALRQFSIIFNRYYWETAILIARNGLARQYRNSFLGMFWTMLQPLTMVMVYTTIMPMIMKTARVENYPLYIVISLPLWSFFHTTLTGACNSLLTNGETLKRCMISSTVFPVADVLRNSYTLSIAFCTMYSVAILFGYAHVHPYLLLVPLYFVPVLIILQATSIAIAFVAPYVRDVGELITMGMTITFWLTPVVYTPSHLPAEAMQYICWNPFYIMMHPIHMLAYGQTMPDLAATASLLGLMLVAIGVGFGIFRLCRRNYVYYL